MQNYPPKYSRALFSHPFSHLLQYFPLNFFFYHMLKMTGFMLHVVGKNFTEIQLSDIETPGYFSQRF